MAQGTSPTNQRLRATESPIQSRKTTAPFCHHICGSQACTCRFEKDEEKKGKREEKREDREEEARTEKLEKRKRGKKKERG